jgi:hypothetical protein
LQWAVAVEAPTEITQWALRCKLSFSFCSALVPRCDEYCLVLEFIPPITEFDKGRKKGIKKRKKENN